MGASFPLVSNLSKALRLPVERVASRLAISSASGFAFVVIRLPSARATGDTSIESNPDWPQLFRDHEIMALTCLSLALIIQEGLNLILRESVNEVQ